ncbi:MAG: DedA family protein [Candidatus Gastranaerophilales bacterium]|nr:DedA family protein [Candidatus Gastranaerophilales bacterium]
MLNEIIIAVVTWIESVINQMGPWGIALLMAIESCNIPLPSEAILPFAGYLVTKGTFSIHTAAFFGAIGCVLGSIPSYYLGYFGGRKFIEKYGKYFLISKHDLETADKWVDKYGDWSFFICRMLPVVRTFISLPAGILKARKRTFFIFTFIGSLVWSYVLVWVGVKVGQNTESLKHIWHKFDAVIIIACLVLGGIYIYHHIKNLKES